MIAVKTSRLISNILKIFYAVIVVIIFFDYLSVIYLPIKWYLALFGSLLFFTSYGLLIEYRLSNIKKLDNLQRHINKIEKSIKNDSSFSDEIIDTDNATIRPYNLVETKKFNNSRIDTYW